MSSVLISVLLKRQSEVLLNSSLVSSILLRLHLSSLTKACVVFGVVVGRGSGGGSGVGIEIGVGRVAEREE